MCQTFCSQKHNYKFITDFLSKLTFKLISKLTLLHYNAYISIILTVQFIHDHLIYTFTLLLLYFSGCLLFTPWGLHLVNFMPLVAWWLHLLCALHSAGCSVLSPLWSAGPPHLRFIPKII